MSSLQIFTIAFLSAAIFSLILLKWYRYKSLNHIVQRIPTQHGNMVSVFRRNGLYGLKDDSGHIFVHPFFESYYYSDERVIKFWMDDFNQAGSFVGGSFVIGYDLEDEVVFLLSKKQVR
jgi:hypothetical protein